MEAALSVDLNCRFVGIFATWRFFLLVSPTRQFVSLTSHVKLLNHHLVPPSTQRPSPPASESFITMSSRTRSTNANKHPGNPDKKRERRTKAQMEEFRAQEAEKQKQKELDEKAKADRLASVERKLAEEVDVTPCPTKKRRLRCTNAFQEPDFPLASNPNASAGDMIPDNSSLTTGNDDDFQPVPTLSSASERADSDKTGDDETETELPPKKKKKTSKQPVHAARVSTGSNGGESKQGKKNLGTSIAVSTLTTKGNQHADGKKLPHGDNVLMELASERHRAINRV